MESGYDGKNRLSSIMAQTQWYDSTTGHIKPTPVWLVLALHLSVEDQEKEQLVAILEKLRYDQALDQTHNLRVWRSKLYN